MKISLSCTKKGLSLIELLIYLAVLSIIMLGIVDIFLITIRSRAENNAKFAVNENARIVLGKIRDAILDGTAVAITGTCPENQLDITIAGSTTSFQIVNGVVQIIEGVSPTKPLTTPNVTAGASASCLFAKIDNPAPAKSTIQIQLRMAYNAPTNFITTISQDYQLTVSLR